MKSISCTTTLNILSLLDTGHSVRDISSRIGVSIGTVSSVRNNHRPDMSKTLGGHPKKLTESNIRLGLCAISSGKADTAIQVHKILQDKTNEDLSVQTVRRGLKQAGMKSTVKTTRPFLSKHHRRERLDFAIAHKDWTVADWKRLIWSDESKINRFGSDGRKWVRKKPRECLSDRTVNTTLKFGGGSIMIWGCMTWEGVGYLCKLMGRWISTSTARFWRMIFRLPWSIMGGNLKMSFFSRTMTPSTLQKWPENGFRIMESQFSHGQHNLQTSIQLNTFGVY